MSAQPLPQLDYAPPPPLARPRRILRQALPWVGAAVVLVLAVQHGPGAWRQFWYLRGQTKCMSFEMPAGVMVYANDPTDATSLLASGYKPVASTIGRSLGSASDGASMSAGFAP